MDDDKYIVSCEGGGLADLTCIYTPTTSDCFVDKTDSSQPGEIPQAADALGLAPVTATGDDSAQGTTVDSPSKGTHDKHGKRGKKGGKHRHR